MPKVAKGIASSCYVKFRYSLFAGAAPFEWVARKKSEISAEQVSKWFEKQLETAQNDVATGRIRPESLPAVPYLLKSLACLNSILGAHVRDDLSLLHSGYSLDCGELTPCLLLMVL